MSAAGGDALVQVAQRQCGRCRQLFAGDATLPAGAIPDWWACPGCRVSLGLDRAGARPAR